MRPQNYRLLLQRLHNTVIVDLVKQTILLLTYLAIKKRKGVLFSKRFTGSPIELVAVCKPSRRNHYLLGNNFHCEIDHLLHYLPYCSFVPSLLELHFKIKVFKYTSKKSLGSLANSSAIALFLISFSQTI